MNPVRRAVQRVSTKLYGPSEGLRGFTWVPRYPRLAIGSIPVGREAEDLPSKGVTHVVNCRKGLQNVISQDLWIEQQVLGADKVAHADMWDHGRPQQEESWVPAALFGAQALRDNPEARVLVHCQQGRRRSLFVAYAILRQMGFSEDDAAAAVLEARPRGHLVPAYRAGVEAWLSRSFPQQSSTLR